MSDQLGELRRLLGAESELLVRRLRGYTAARYAAAAAPFDSRAGVARHLLEGLALAGQGVEAAAAATEPAWRAVPDLPVLALGDATAVMAHDLVAALASRPAAAWTRGRRRPSLELAAQTLAEVLLHRRDLDGSTPGTEAASAAMAVLAPDRPATPGELLRLAMTGCSAYGPWQADRPAARPTTAS